MHGLKSRRYFQLPTLSIFEKGAGKLTCGAGGEVREAKKPLSIHRSSNSDAEMPAQGPRGSAKNL